MDNEDESWEGSCLAKFNEFLGFPTEGLEEVIFDFMKMISGSRQKGNGKGAPTLTKFDRELKRLEWNVKDKGRSKGVASGRGARVSQSSF